MKNKNIFKINLIYFTAISLVAVLFLLGYLGILQNEFLTSFLIQIVVMFAIPLLMHSLLVKRTAKQSLSDCGFKKISGKTLAISIILGVILYFVNSFVADTAYGILSLFGYENLSSSETINLNYGLLFKELVLSCILPGFCEEFLHRGIMLISRKKHANTKHCLIISSILFGLTHLNIRQFFYATILGFLMGLVGLVSNSIFPCMIIHFMNNFLGNYFVYGTYLNWPLARFVNFITNLFSSNLFIYITSSTMFVCGLLWLYFYLLKKLSQERAKCDIQKVVKALQMERLTLIQAQIQFNQINQLLKHNTFQEQSKPKQSFADKIFLISSFVLGGIVTISSFIWGII